MRAMSGRLARCGVERQAHSVERHQTLRLDMDVQIGARWIDVNAVSQHHPTLVVERDVDKALRAGDLGRDHLDLEWQRVRRAHTGLEMMSAEADRGRAWRGLVP